MPEIMMMDLQVWEPYVCSRHGAVQAAGDVVSEVERAVEQYSKGVGHLCQKLPLPGLTNLRYYCTVIVLRDEAQNIRNSGVMMFELL